MVQAVRDFAEGLRKGLAIAIHCPNCGKRVLYRARDFDGHIKPGASIEDLRWRCSWCGTLATYVRWCLIQDINRESLAQWMPPKRTHRKGG